MSKFMLSDSSLSMNQRVFTIILLRDSIEFLYTSNKKKIIDKELLAKMGKS
jgi:hypothetical protein